MPDDGIIIWKTEEERSLDLSQFEVSQDYLDRLGLKKKLMNKLTENKNSKIFNISKCGGQFSKCAMKDKNSKYVVYGKSKDTSI